MIDLFWPTMYLSITTIWLSTRLLQEAREHRLKIKSQSLPNGTLTKINKPVTTNGVHDHKISYNQSDTPKYGLSNVKLPLDPEKGEVIQGHLNPTVPISDGEVEHKCSSIQLNGKLLTEETISKDPRSESHGCFGKKCYICSILLFEQSSKQRLREIRAEVTAEEYTAQDGCEVTVQQPTQSIK